MTSLIGLQIARARLPETVQALEDLRARFATLTSIYIDLDEANERPIALDQFIPDLVRRIGELYDPKSRHAIAFDIAPVELVGERAAVLGQIVVELVMNAYRHAFAEQDSGLVTVILDAQSNPDAVLVIADNGPGLRAPEDPGRAHLGMRIVTRLAATLGGTFEHESHDGFVARVRFRLDR